MNQHWNTFLSTQGASFDDQQQIISFDSQQSASNSAQLFDLSYQGILAVNGPDASKFLQGQLSCDLTKVTDRQSQLGCYCTIKGRVISSFRIVHHDNGFYLVMNKDLVSVTQTILSKFIVFFKAEMTDASDEHIRIGILGEQATALLEKDFEEVPPEPNQVFSNSYGTLIQVGTSTTPRIEIWTTTDKAQELWQKLQQHAKPTASNDWQLANIQSGLLDIHPTISEELTPHNVNYQATGHIDFKKGCYTGQEVIARIHYRGQSKKRLYRVTINSPIKLNTPESLLEIINDQNEIIGNTLSIAHKEDTTYEALAILNSNKLENCKLALQSNPQSAIELLSLPYKV